ncbi:MAG: ABC transporter permease [Prosthecochloris sp.]|uniref:ABC transporter permease n=1 Tax=unclassified Prosthecochloris TaxID=2632826 RepID=UPI000DF851AA|nr:MULTISPECIES: ABC transporter permease [unclassified Prosthecochloris]MCW8797637.1 ABC transporter permease [Prosthecochloris sp.]RDD29986.1 ABC transporter [Prosthecochloris sp. ZM]
MKTRELVIQASTSLRSNLLRSWLTTMGVAVGVFSIIAVMTALQAIDQSVATGLSSLGANTFEIQKYPATFFGGHGRNRFINRPDITYDEGLAFKRLMQGKAKNIGLKISQSGNQAIYENRSTNPDVTLFGADENFAVANGFDIDTGRNLIENDILYSRNVIIIGHEIRNTLFPNGENPVGKSIRMNGEVYRIIGVFIKKGAAFGQSQDNLAAIPITRYIDHIDLKRSISITVEAASPKEYQATIDQSTGSMRVARGLAIREDNDFEFRTNESLVESFRDFQKTISIGAFIISFMALITAGVGIMNIMLVSVTERTREIGIRKSIGAPATSILRQFLLEALFLSLTGGLIGIILGIGAGNLVAMAFNLPPLIPWLWIVISIAVCSAIGVSFGIFPAYKAAGLNPVEALRSR